MPTDAAFAKAQKLIGDFNENRYTERTLIDAIAAALARQAEEIERLQKLAEQNNESSIKWNAEYEIIRKLSNQLKAENARLWKVVEAAQKTKALEQEMSHDVHGVSWDVLFPLFTALADLEEPVES